MLTHRLLGKAIQQATHDSVEDARAAMELALLKIERGPAFGLADGFDKPPSAPLAMAQAAPGHAERAISGHAERAPWRCACGMVNGQNTLQCGAASGMGCDLERHSAEHCRCGWATAPTDPPARPTPVSQHEHAAQGCAADMPGHAERQRVGMASQASCSATVWLYEAAVRSALAMHMLRRARQTEEDAGTEGGRLYRTEGVYNCGDKRIVTWQDHDKGLAGPDMGLAGHDKVLEGHDEVLEGHDKGSARWVIRKKSGKIEKYFCTLCKVKLNLADFQTHVNGARHQRAVNEQAVRARANPSTAAATSIAQRGQTTGHAVPSNLPSNVPSNIRSNVPSNVAEDSRRAGSDVLGQSGAIERSVDLPVEQSIEHSTQRSVAIDKVRVGTVSMVAITIWAKTKSAITIHAIIISRLTCA